jgi:hypothetical protein
LLEKMLGVSAELLKCSAWRRVDWTGGDGSTAVMWTLMRLQMSMSRRHGYSERGGETKQGGGHSGCCRQRRRQEGEK